MEEERLSAVTVKFAARRASRTGAPMEPEAPIKRTEVIVIFSFFFFFLILGWGVYVVVVVIDGRSQCCVIASFANGFLLSILDVMQN